MEDDRTSLTLLPLLADHPTTLAQFGQTIVSAVVRWSSVPEGKRALAASKTALLCDRDPDDNLPDGNHSVFSELHPSNALDLYAIFVFILMRCSAAMSAEVVDALHLTGAAAYAGRINIGSIDALFRMIINSDDIIGFPNLWGALAHEPMVSAATRRRMRSVTFAENSGTSACS